MKMVKVVAKQFVNFGKQEDGKLLYFREGEEKEVPLTDTIARAIENGFLDLVKEKKSPKKVIVDGGTVNVGKRGRRKKTA